MPKPVKSDPPAGRLSLGVGHLIFLGVLLLRLGALLRLAHSPLLLPSRGDMHFYNDWAKDILHGQFSQHLAFYGLPGYPYLLAFLYKFFGENPFVPGFLQAGIEAGGAVLIYQICLQVLDSVALTSFVNTRLVGLFAALCCSCFSYRPQRYQLLNPKYSRSHRLSPFSAGNTSRTSRDDPRIDHPGGSSRR